MTMHNVRYEDYDFEALHNVEGAADEILATWDDFLSEGVPDDYEYVNTGREALLNLACTYLVDPEDITPPNYEQ